MDATLVDCLFPSDWEMHTVHTNSTTLGQLLQFLGVKTL